MRVQIRPRISFRFPSTMALLSVVGQRDSGFHGDLELSEVPIMQCVLQHFMVYRYHPKVFSLMIFFSSFGQICVSHC